MEIQLRDSKGRFNGTTSTEIEAMIAAENEEAEKLVKAYDLLELKPEEFGVKKRESGNYFIDHKARPMFSGIIIGLALSLKRSRKKNVELLRATLSTLEIQKAK
jgi:hypothetical protein